MKTSKHMKPKEKKKEKVSANHFEEPLAVFEYEDTPKNRTSPEEIKKVPKAVYRAGAILILVIIALALWLNRESLKPANIKTWFTLQLKGDEVAEGFPVGVKGNQVDVGGFQKAAGSAAVLSDTALTVLQNNGTETSYIRHSFANPALKTAGGYSLIYDVGMEGYLLASGQDELLNQKADSKLYFADVAANGNFVLGTQDGEYASELAAYKKDGTPLYRYSFAFGYGVAAALNPSGTGGAVCTLNSSGGELTSTITILDFSRADPVLEYSLSGNMVIDLFWTDAGKIMAVGDSGVSVLSATESSQTDYSYSGRKITAYCADGEKLFTALSDYEYGGNGSIVIFDTRQKETTVIETDKRVLSLSASGNSLAALTVGGAVRFYDSTSGQAVQTADAGADARAVALANETSAYVLGASEIRKVTAQ